MEFLVASMELGVGLLHEGDPKLVLIGVVAVEWRLRLRVVRDTRINDHILPPAVLEEEEHGEPILDSVVVNQVLQELGVRAQDQQGAEEPAIIETEQTLLDVSRTIWVGLHLWLVVRRYLLWPLPLNHWHVLRVFGWTGRVGVEGVVVCGEFRVTEKGIVFRTNLNDLLYLILNRVLFDALLLHVVLLIRIMHHFLPIVILLLAVYLLLREHLLVLLLTNGVPHLINNLLRTIILSCCHHLLILLLFI